MSSTLTAVQARSIAEKTQAPIEAAYSAIERVAKEGGVDVSIEIPSITKKVLVEMVNELKNNGYDVSVTSPACRMPVDIEKEPVKSFRDKILKIRW